MNTKPKAKVKNDILKISKKVLIVFAILTMILTLMGNYNNSFARSRRRKTINITSVDESYSIKNFKIDAKVTETNEILIREEMDVFFEYDKHGIYRVIPETNTIIADGKKQKVEARVRNIKVNAPYTSTEQDGYKILMIGDKNKTISGDQKYIIEYTYSIQKYNTNDGIDEFYFNVLGDKINTTVGNLEFKIEFPKGYQKDNVYMYAADVVFDINDKTTEKTQGLVKITETSENAISGKIDTEIEPFTAVTLRGKLGKDYFKVRNPYTDILVKIGTGAAVITFIYGLTLLLKYGKDKKLPDIISFKIPKELDVSKTYYVKYKDASDYTKIIPALIIEFANEGYIQIGDGSGREEKGIFKTREKDKFDIIKVKDYEGEKYKKEIFKALFSKGDTVTEKTIKKVGKELVDAVGSASEVMKNSEFDKEVYDQSGLRTCMEIIRNNNNTSSTITISWNRILWE